jgi:hypothetical protein
MLQQLEQQQVQQERRQQQGLLFYRKQRERQQPRESPTGAIFSCEFSLKGMKTISGNCHDFHHDQADGLKPYNSAGNYRVCPSLFSSLCQSGVK